MEQEYVPSWQSTLLLFSHNWTVVSYNLVRLSLNTFWRNKHIYTCTCVYQSELHKYIVILITLKFLKYSFNFWKINIQWKDKVSSPKLDSGNKGCSNACLRTSLFILNEMQL